MSRINQFFLSQLTSLCERVLNLNVSSDSLSRRNSLQSAGRNDGEMKQNTYAIGGRNSPSSQSRSLSFQSASTSPPSSARRPKSGYEPLVASTDVASDKVGDELLECFDLYKKLKEFRNLNREGMRKVS